MRAVLLFLTLPLVACLDADGPVNPGDTEEREFVVPSGATAGGLTTRLEEAGLIPGTLQWKIFLRQRDASCLKAGRHRVRGDMSLNQLVDSLCAPPLPEDVPFTVVEGWRISDTDAALAAKGWIEAGAYITAATRKSVDAPFDVTGPTFEGYLFPETYMVVPDRFSAEGFVARQLQTFNDRFLEPHRSDLGARTLHDVVIVASMLEREEPKPSQRPVTAGIIWKRLDASWQLGIDATSHYTLAEWNDRKAFLGKLRDPTDPYNTRLNKGLPPTAIGGPSISSLEAAIQPIASEWWFYLHDSKGTFHGARNGDEHDANRKRYNVY